uniref:histidine kinase n=1 Tax=Rhodopseudomonas palustris (strain BisA53) TaxID=316055 RepID=Q07SX2_RHOP5
MMEALSRYGAIFRGVGLIHRFWIAAAVTIFVSMTVLAYAVSHRFESIAMRAAAEEGALLVGTFLGPEVQELANSRTLSSETVQRLDQRLHSKLGERVKVIKIWLRDGTLVYATDKRMVGQKFPSSHLEIAFAGRVSGSFNQLDDNENRFERDLHLPLIEIYAPFHRTGTDEVIAVGEIYNDGGRLAADLKGIRWTTAGIVGAITAPMMAVLFLMVWRANMIVTRNRESLSRKIEEARNLAMQNDQLRREADDARLEVIQSNEQLLGSIGQDLHDGPIQMLSILMLKLPVLAANGQAFAGSLSSPLNIAADLAANALSELRDISMGLVLPQLEGLTVKETLLLAVQRHEGLTGTRVERDIGDLSFYPTAPLRTCLFRVVQEGLNNAYYYAKGNGQHVAATLQDRWIVITVSDRGNEAAGPRPSDSSRKTGLGLAGLQRRASSLGGSLHIGHLPQGTELRVWLPIS